ncbi:MAG: cell wall hydrolase, partial [Lachnospiraceae bacterium]|nr:cell wall hydrolase [Lachnospiraceae bacterium]
MLLYGDGKAGYVMDEEGKKNLKKVFDEMNYIDAASSAVEMDVGDSLGKVWVTAYCPCSICCGPYANGITASGKTARA